MRKTNLMKQEIARKGRTSFKDAQSGVGINNPRIIKRRVIR